MYHVLTENWKKSPFFVIPEVEARLSPVVFWHLLYCFSDIKVDRIKDNPRCSRRWSIKLQQIVTTSKARLFPPFRFDSPRLLRDLCYTLPRKNMNLPYSICSYWTNFWQPTVHKKTLIDVGSSHLYASLGTFCVQSDPFSRQSETENFLKTVKSLFSKENDFDFEFFRKLKVPLHCDTKNGSIWTQKVPLLHTDTYLPS